MKSLRQFAAAHKAACFVLMFCLVIGLQLVVTRQFLDRPMLVDENAYAPQALGFIDGYSGHLIATSASPAFPALVAGAVSAWAFFWPPDGGVSRDLVLWCGRIMNGLFSLLAVVTAFLIARRLGKRGYLTACQAFFVPIVLPFISVFYTDMPALALLLVSVYFALDGSIGWSALGALLAVFTRQPMIAWIALPAYILYEKKGARALAPFVAIVALFLAFVAWNKGVALGDRAHQEATFNITSLWVCLVTYALCNAFEVAYGTFKDLFSFSHSKMNLALYASAILSFCLVFGLTFHATHPYNLSYEEYFLRNMLIRYVESHAWAMALASFAAAAGLWHLVRMRFSSCPAWVFLSIATLSFIAMPLVDPRYYIPIFVLLACFATPRHESATVAWIQLCLNVALSVFISVGVFAGRFFP